MKCDACGGTGITGFDFYMNAVKCKMCLGSGELRGYIEAPN